MRKKAIFLVPALFCLLAVVFFVVVNQQESGKTSPSPLPSSTPKSAAIVAATTPEAVPTLHPASLLRLRDHKLVGSDFTIGKVLEENSAYTRHYITYKSNDLTISGIMNRPKGNGPFPVLILNHGYIDPKVYTNGRGLRREQDYLARRGFLVVHSDYRNHADSSKDPNPNVHFQLSYDIDVINAINALKAARLPYADTTRIGILGHSMGGGIALSILVSHPDLVKAAVLFAPVSGLARENFTQYMSKHPEAVEEITNAYGNPDSNPDFWAAISPATYYSEIKTPVMVHQGTADKDVPQRWSDQLAAALQATGKEVTYYTYPGEPHEFINAWPTVMQRTAEFFSSKLK